MISYQQYKISSNASNENYKSREISLTGKVNSCSNLVSFAMQITKTHKNPSRRDALLHRYATEQPSKNFNKNMRQKAKRLTGQEESEYKGLSDNRGRISDL